VKRAVYHSAVWLVLPLWLILLGSVLARVGILAHENHLFATEARHTNGVVLRRIVQHFHGAHNSFMFLLLYTYTAGDLQGRCITEVTPETFDRVQDGGPLPIDYLPENPRDNRIAYPWENIGAVWGPFDDSVLAAMVFVPGACLAWYFGSRNRIHARLKAAGSNGVGEVTEVRKSHGRCGSSTYLTFRFTTAQGLEIAGRSPPVRAHEPTHWQAGDPIRIFYDPNNPARFAVDTDHPLDMLLPDERPPTPVEATIWA